MAFLFPMTPDTSVLERTEVPKGTPVAAPARAGSVRPHVRGKFLFLGEEKLYLKGVTYGTFQPGPAGHGYPDPQTVRQDFAQMAAAGVNTVRLYTLPPRWLLDAALEHGLRAMVGIPWEEHITFLDSRRRRREIEERVREAVRSCAGHPAVLCYAVGNEIPASIVRWYGRRRIERFLERLYRAAKQEDPAALVTYVSYPTTEYLQLPFLDLVCFNVYLESQKSFESYLARLHNIAGDRPLVLAEVGLDSRRNGERAQAQSLEWQMRTTFASGSVGLFVFAWTDEWHRGGFSIEDWDFGLTTRDRRAKLALEVVREVFAEVPFPRDLPWPKISVVVCTYNGSRTIRRCCEGLLKLDYPCLEVVVVNDGSTDPTPAIVQEYAGRGFKLVTTPNRGLSSARNTGREAASGEIVAYLDDDAVPDPHWLMYLAAAFLGGNFGGIGGPNIPPPGEGLIADCVANAPGGPLHVLLTDREAEHIPGCNMAFWKTALNTVNGFDPQFRAAGDDVDLCWRIQRQGWKLGFAPGAMVWHCRRNSVRTYWRQQRGYGRAEALLEQKWPEKYNAIGHLSWSGRIYGKGLTESLGFHRRRIYHGAWGSAPFQSLYETLPDGVWSLPLMPEWYLILAGLAGCSALGMLWRPMWAALPLLALGIGATFLQAGLSASRAVFSSDTRLRGTRMKLRCLTWLLHLLQPLARLWGRLSYGLSPWRQKLHRFVFPWPRTVSVWSERWRAPQDRVAELAGKLRQGRNVVLSGGEYDRWDLEVRAGVLGATRFLLTAEEHGAGRQMVRLRIWPRVSAFGMALTVLFSGVSASAFTDGARWAGTFLGLAAALLGMRIFQECANSAAAALDAFEHAERTP